MIFKLNSRELHVPQNLSTAILQKQIPVFKQNPEKYNSLKKKSSRDNPRD
jgi:hypothetical protein